MAFLDFRPDLGGYTHCREVCVGQPCSLHHPSAHHMVDWPLLIRWDREDALAERVCTHGVGHPDPDSLAFLLPQFPMAGVHGCCGCCGPPDG